MTKKKKMYKQQKPFMTGSIAPVLQSEMLYFTICPDLRS